MADRPPGAPAPEPAAPPFFRAPCPSCGAPVELRSATSAFAVCSYCRSSLSLRGQALEQVGKVSAVLEDYSPLRIGAAGRLDGQGFAVIGRIQMRYAGGGWNEWHLLRDDGRTGWLSDASGQYAVLSEAAWPPDLPGFEALTAGRSFLAEGRRYTVADHREAQCSGAEGELPFAVGERWTARLVDARSEDRFLTLDWSGPQPAAYTGRSVTLAGLQMQFLRSAAEIGESAGRLRGSLASLACPQCGASVPVAAGLTLRARCPSCGSELDTAGTTATLLVRGREAEARTGGTALQVGDAGTLKGVRWMVLGIVRQRSRADGETYDWTEYLLYQPDHGFRWLSDAAGQWLFTEVSDRWPMRMTGDRVRLGDATFRLDDRYEAVTQAAWGSFPWEARTGDRAACEEFLAEGRTAHPAGTRLVCETSEREQVWSLSTPIDRQQVLAAFGRSTGKPTVGSVLRAGARAEGPGGVVREWAGYAMIGHVLLWTLEPTVSGFFIGLGALLTLGVWGWVIEGDS